MNPKFDMVGFANALLDALHKIELNNTRRTPHGQDSYVVDKEPLEPGTAQTAHVLDTDKGLARKTYSQGPRQEEAMNDLERKWFLERFCYRCDLEYQCDHDKAEEDEGRYICRSFVDEDESIERTMEMTAEAVDRFWDEVKEGVRLAPKMGIFGFVDRHRLNRYMSILGRNCPASSKPRN